MVGVTGLRGVPDLSEVFLLGVVVKGVSLAWRCNLAGDWAGYCIVGQQAIAAQSAGP